MSSPTPKRFQESNMIYTFLNNHLCATMKTIYTFCHTISPFPQKSWTVTLEYNPYVLHIREDLPPSPRRFCDIISWHKCAPLGLGAITFLLFSFWISSLAFTWPIPPLFLMSENARALARNIQVVHPVPRRGGGRLDVSAFFVCCPNFSLYIGGGQPG